MIAGALEALNQLKSLPLSDVASASTMPMFAFGDLETVPSARGGTKQIGEFSLHVQCPWRLMLAERVIVGSGDYFVETCEEVEESERARYESLCKERFRDLFSTTAKEQFIVNEIKPDTANGFKLLFSGGFVLEVIPATSYDVEMWRLLRPGHPGSHFVCRSAV